MPSPEGWEGRQGALDPDALGRYAELAADWSALLAVLRDDPDFGLRVVEADAVAVLVQWFRPGEGWARDPDRWGVLGENAYGVAWAFDGVHDEDRVFNGLPASGRRVSVVGFTVIGPDPVGGPRAVIRRYVDWAGVFGQLGLTLNWRLPVPSEGGGSGGA